MKKISLLLILAIACGCSPDEEPTNESPQLSNFRIENQLITQFLNSDEMYAFSFSASDDNNLKEYVLELRDSDGNLIQEIKRDDCRGRSIFLADSFSIPGNVSAGSYQLHLKVGDFDNKTNSLSQSFILRVGIPNWQITMDKERYQEGDLVKFSGFLEDEKDLEAFRIFIHRVQNVSTGMDTVGEVIYREFPGANDTYFDLDTENISIQLPQSMIIDNYGVEYWLRDSDGNTLTYSGSIYIEF